jgi:1-acyl-sn-glycerol-3-phosphate acyltransferase
MGMPHRPRPDVSNEVSLLLALRPLLAALKAFDPDRPEGRNPALIRFLLPYAQWANRNYFALRRDGFEHIPEGPALFIANHNGGIAGPDLCCTLATLWEHLGPDAPLHPLAHDFAMRQLKPFGAFLQQFGALRATPENAHRILNAGGKVLVYPGGDLDAYRHSAKRNKVVLGKRDGFVRVAQETGAPIVPIVAYGAHRSAYIFSEGKRLAQWTGLKRWGRLERFPMAVALPWGLAIGPWIPYLPLPFPIRLRMLPPIHVPKNAAPQAARREIQSVMQDALDALGRGYR